MPTYSYQCDSCESRLDIFTKMSLKDDQKCPSCGAKLTQVPTAPLGFGLKGVEASASWSTLPAASKMEPVNLTTSPKR